MNPSWRTNLAGMGVIFGTLLRCGIETHKGMPVDYATCGIALATGLGLLFARDQEAHVEDVEDKKIIPSEK